MSPYPHSQREFPSLSDDHPSFDLSQLVVWTIGVHSWKWRPKRRRNQDEAVESGLATLVSDAR